MFFNAEGKYAWVFPHQRACRGLIIGFGLSILHFLGMILALYQTLSPPSSSSSSMCTSPTSCLLIALAGGPNNANAKGLTWTNLIGSLAWLTVNLGLIYG